jgi:hypothetical protein
MLKAEYIRCVRCLHLGFSNTISNHRNRMTGLEYGKAPSHQLTLHCDPILTHKPRDVAVRLSRVLGGERSIHFPVHLGHSGDILQSDVLPRNLKNSPELLRRNSVDIELLGSGLEIEIFWWNEVPTVRAVGAILHNHAPCGGL